ncbi:hypothetical protein L3Q82_004000 [Scortum barcoo]|uniref:Uncharacterized protein n=1 Tax=Scortum barcoo TaxID=214431 RepID=A0ACB8X6N2_9TELE|nr:hypothetical protein L3Q82_004000 [Scortum barcoo]
MSVSSSPVTASRSISSDRYCKSDCIKNQHEVSFSITAVFALVSGHCSLFTCHLYEYHFITENKTWDEAQSYCRETHTDLATVFDMTDMKRLRDSTKNDGNAWIGLYNEPEKGKGEWHWSSARDKVILIKENKTWTEALYYCRENHYDLISITNLAEQWWVQERAKNASTDFVWLGLRYTCTLDFWFWISDEQVDYKNWASEEKMDDCDMSAAMEKGGEHKWHKKADNSKFNFICT